MRNDLYNLYCHHCFEYIGDLTVNDYEIHVLSHIDPKDRQKHIQLLKDLDNAWKKFFEDDKK